MKVGAQKGTVQEEVAEDVVEGSEVKALGKITNLVLELKTIKLTESFWQLLLLKPMKSKSRFSPFTLY